MIRNPPLISIMWVTGGHLPFLRDTLSKNKILAYKTVCSLKQAVLFCFCFIYNEEIEMQQRKEIS